MNSILPPINPSILELTYNCDNDQVFFVELGSIKK
jgi:hypothetical protein